MGSGSPVTSRRSSPLRRASARRPESAASQVKERQPESAASQVKERQPESGTSCPRHAQTRASHDRTHGSLRAPYGTTAPRPLSDGRSWTTALAWYRRRPDVASDVEQHHVVGKIDDCGDEAGIKIVYCRPELCSPPLRSARGAHEQQPTRDVDPGRTHGGGRASHRGAATSAVRRPLRWPWTRSSGTVGVAVTLIGQGEAHRSGRVSRGRRLVRDRTSISCFASA
jgi:hypothetical protein